MPAAVTAANRDGPPKIITNIPRTYHSQPSPDRVAGIIQSLIQRGGFQRFTRRISEALTMKLPVIVECNARTLPQERYNAAWVLEKQVGLVLRSFRQITQTVEVLLAPANFTRYRSNAAAMNNRAVFEIPGMVCEILSKGTS